MAHLSDNRCIKGLNYIYYTCKDDSWQLEFRGDTYKDVDQIYCYESEECTHIPYILLFSIFNIIIKQFT